MVPGRKLFQDGETEPVGGKKGAEEGCTAGAGSWGEDCVVIMKAPGVVGAKQCRCHKTDKGGMQI